MTCQTPATTFATTLVVRHGAVSASPRPMASRDPAAPYGPVTRTVNGLLHAGARNIDLTARAVTMANRDRAAARAYLAKHQALANEIYSGGEA